MGTKSYLVEEWDAGWVGGGCMGGDLEMEVGVWWVAEGECCCWRWGGAGQGCG